MVNERKTENLVREHFSSDPYLSNVIIEEQRSDYPKISKLLSNASKKGTSFGSPEFIISYKNRELLIVIECKASIKDHHLSENEVLHYASFLCKEYDIIAIAVSGDKNNSRISHFLQLKNTHVPISFAGNKFLSLRNYEESWKKNETKFNQEYHKLLGYSKELNEKLHSRTYEIPENLRALLVSGILIGLQSSNFNIKGNDGTKKHPKDLAEDLITAIIRILEKCNIQGTKIQNLRQTYSFITNHKQLCEDSHNLYDLIDNIDQNVNSFIKNYRYFDILGQFYIEFLKYANGDKTLGIVLTPPHITEFFTEITEVNKDSIIIDNCTGTGGFLIASMKKMVKDAKDDEQKILEIKQQQLIGIENKAHVFSLAISNMFIHGDGKSNIYHNSCFDILDSKISLAQFIKEKYKPNIGMLNPPYRTKKSGIQEFEFILNNLEMLSVGAKCIAIIPTSCVLAKTGDEFELKKKLLEMHTLEAVFSMPEQLFYPVGVITSVILITAHKPNNNSYTFLGMYKDDGYVIKRHKGRLDYENKWENIKNTWIERFRSKQSVTGFSLVKQLTANQEWCAEEYLETDYSKLTQEDFSKILKEYAGYLIIYDQSLSNEISYLSVHTENIKLQNENWLFFKINTIFDIEKGNELSGDGEADGEGLQLISTSYFNNGVVGYLSNGKKRFSKNCITVACNGAAMGTTFYQDKDFYATADVNILIPKFKLNPYIGLFLSVIIRQEKYRFNYGRKWGKDRMLETTIKLPALSNKEPNWNWMENYIKTLPYSSSLEKNS